MPQMVGLSQQTTEGRRSLAGSPSVKTIDDLQREGDIAHNSDAYESEAPGVEVTHIFWTENREYHAIMRDKIDYKRVKRDVNVKDGKALPALLAKADVKAYCRNYNATIKFGFHGMNLFQLIREDL
jgi:hypothetical protein